jgi:hypothetical protein
MGIQVLGCPWETLSSGPPPTKNLIQSPTKDALFAAMLLVS